MKYSIFLIFPLLFSCTVDKEYYSLEDYQNVDKIDAHIHVRTDRDAFVEQARKDRFKLLNIVVDSRDKAFVREQYGSLLGSKDQASR